MNREPAAGAPEVSIIVPVFNGELYIEEAIGSVFAQTFADFEVIVVDDGSTDGTPGVLDAFGDSIVRRHHPNRGLSATRNAGIEIAAGRYLAFLDADDRWLPEKLERQHGLCEADPGVDMVFSHVRQFFSSEMDEEERRRIRIPRTTMPGYFATTAFVRRAAYDRVGPFSTDLRVGEFIDWYARGRDRGLRSELLPQVLAERRIHANNMGAQERDSRRDYLRVLKAALHRRRAESAG